MNTCIGQTLFLNRLFYLMTVISYFLQLSLGSSFRAVIDKLKSRFCATVLIGCLVCNRLALISLRFGSVRIHSSPCFPNEKRS